MGVYIKGTKDELFEDGCPCRNSEYGYCQITRRECQYGYECPLVEVSDQGDDLISRKRAIEAIRSHSTELLERYDYELEVELLQDIYKMAHRHIEELIEQL